MLQIVLDPSSTLLSEARSSSDPELTCTSSLAESLTCLCLPKLELQVRGHVHWHFVGSRDLISGPHTCMADALAEEPSPQLLGVFFCMNCPKWVSV